MSKTKELLDNLIAERNKIEDIVGPLREKRNALAAKIQPIEDEMRNIALQIKEAQSERAFDLDNEIATLSRALGARSMSKGE